MVKNFLSIDDVNKKELLALLDRAAELKKEVKKGKDQTKLLRGKSLGLIFEKPSLRTRISFDVGMKQLGGSVLVLNSSEIQIGEREARSDVAKVMSCYLDALMIRTFGHEVLTETASFATIPIINGLSDLEHPCQTMADLLTIKEHFGSFKGLKIAYVGDGNNTVHSLMLACTKLGIQLSVASPLEYEPSEEFRSEFTTLTHSVAEATQDADVIYTDVWSSMGQERDAVRRKKIFSGYQISMKLLDEYAKPEAIVLHCLPAHRGEEITTEVIDKHEATILNQAENRLHAQKAILLSLMAQ
ncbi:MAG: ornithine carbamoyltransferase [Candidatus Melainabacteria bacterium]|nr:ornithine carbamoyltransferase [Candidatus Melainabacteria bacterium]